MSKDADVSAVRLVDYRPPAYRIEATDLTFELGDDATRVTSRLTVRRNPHTPVEAPLVLDGSGLELLAIRLDGVALGSNQFRVEGESLSIFDMPASAEIEIVTRIYPEANTALEGLYKSSGMYCTQCEAEGFRRITYYLDRPDVLARFRTTIIADPARYPVALSNGNPVIDERLADGRRRVTWEDPFPKPSYLFALVAGDLALLEDTFTTGSGRKVALHIYSEPHNISQCSYAMAALKRAMRWDEAVYGREYDLDIFMIVAVEDFNMGAMENKGLNIFNTSCVLATPDTATDASYQRVEAVVAHEYFHNWSGNRVTCRDWFQLSLKEGFTVFRDAQFSAAMHSATVKRIENVTLLRSVQFAEDAGPLAHPVRPDSYLEISNFYTPTVYEKGAEVVGMLHTLLGPTAFRAGSDLYFERHDGTAATTDDFLAAMSEAGAIDLTQFRRWYEQAGTPVLRVSTHWSNETFTVRFEQSCPATPGQPVKLPMHIPLRMGLLDPRGNELSGGGLTFIATDPVEVRGLGANANLLVHVRSPICELSVTGVRARPVLSLLRGFSAPVRLEYPRDPTELAFLAEHDSDGFARWDAMQTLLVGALRERMTGAVNDAALVPLFGRLVDAALASPADAERLGMLAAMLRLPDENYLYEQFTPVDVEGIDRALQGLTEAIAHGVGTRWGALFEQHSRIGAYVPDSLDMARRGLKQVALGYWVRGLDPERAAAVLERVYREADNLTDRRMALAELTRHPELDPGLLSTLLDDFLARWRHEALVVNHWFSLQAASPRYSAARLAELVRHPAFDARNPNKLRAVYATFAQYNPRNFHAADGSGYALLADAVRDLDRSNPQVAARLATPLTRWRRYLPARQALMQASLQRLAGATGLSRDLYEVVSKGLDGD